MTRQLNIWCPVDTMTVLLLLSISLWNFGYGLKIENQTSGYVVVEEGIDILDTVANPKQREAYDSYDGYQGDQNLCPGKTSCVTLAECRLLLDLMERTCLLPNKLKELTCGYRRNEPMVCCPQGGNNSPFKPGGNNNNNNNNGNPGNNDGGGSGGGGGGGGGGGDGTNPSQGQGLNQDCGKPQLNGWKNGYSGLGSQPWVARIGFKNSDTGNTDYPCCGSIITPKVVLTAAHCALAKSEGHSLSSVRVGEYDNREDPDCTNSFCAHPMQNIDVAHVIVHPGFERSIFRHDVALLVLKQPMNYSLSAQPICLLQNANIPLVSRRAKLVGWGKLPGQDVVPSRQQQLELPIVALETCSKIYGRVIPITTNQLCVGGEAKKDACSGFGGAPLVVLDHVMRDRYYQVGMVSFGSDKCGAAGVPSVFTHIQHYYDWIKSNIPS